MNPLLLVDSYKIHHTKMYPENMTKLYSNLTARKSRMPGINSVVFFGLQHFIKDYLIKKFNEEFFNPHITSLVDIKEPNPYAGEQNERPAIWKFESKKVTKEELIAEYKRHCPVDTTHIEQLFDLGYLPIEIKAVPEGMKVPIGVPCLTITNTHPDFGWLVNYLETLLSCMIWQPITSATIAHNFKNLLDGYAMETTGSTEGVQWQGHDFSMRGMSSPESAILSAMGHLLSFTGTDTVPAIYQLERSYNATGLIGASVPATEHSVMCMGTKESEKETISRLMKLYPEGILSIVLDTWDQTKIAKPAEDGTLYQLKDEIMSRNGKLVDRPDSGDPVDIICGHDRELTEREKQAYYPEFYHKGLVQCLWEIFGGTMVTGADGKQYKQLDSHIGAIYGDSINMERAKDICERLKAKGFASTNIVLGIGSFTYQYNTRDTFGFAMKATYGEIKHEVLDPKDGSELYSAEEQKDGSLKFYNSEPREIFKDPITDDGTKKSKKGLLQVIGEDVHNEGFLISVQDQQTWEEEGTGLLKTVFKDSKLVRETSLEEIRSLLNN